MYQERVLIIDDEPFVRFPLAQKLEREGFIVSQAENGHQGLVKFKEEDVDLILLDLKLPDQLGVEVLASLREIDTDVSVIMMTGHGTVETAVQAMKLGAFDYLTKPVSLEALMQTINRSLEMRRLKRQVQGFRRQSKRRDLDQLIGKSPHMKRVITLATQVAQSEAANVLLLGESGSGKNLLAEVIHNESPRNANPFVVVTCTAMPAQLIESELFGHEKGAFTDAKATKKGLCEIANGGTLFLDEIGDMPLDLQAKLLGFIESKSFRRIGGVRNIHVNLRVVAATNKDLSKEIQMGRFREDLYYRLNVFQIDLPPLRNRPEDIPALAQHFVDYFNAKLGKKITGIAPDVMDALLRYPWPGNIREFQNMVERSMILAEGATLTFRDFPRDMLIGDERDRQPQEFMLPPEGLDFHELERSLVRQALERTDWNQTRAAKLLGFTRDQMRYRVKQFGFN